MGAAVNTQNKRNADANFARGKANRVKKRGKSRKPGPARPAGSKLRRKYATKEAPNV